MTAPRREMVANDDPMDRMIGVCEHGCKRWCAAIARCDGRGRLRHQPNFKTIESMSRIAPSGCWEWTGSVNPQGYGVLGGKYAHRVSYTRARGPIPAGMHVCHSCDNPSCVNPDHLWLGSHVDNMRDMSAKGRRAPPCEAFVKSKQQGSRHGQAKLTEHQVRSILMSTDTGAALARKLHVSESSISRIRRGSGWTHVGVPQ